MKRNLIFIFLVLSILAVLVSCTGENENALTSDLSKEEISATSESVSEEVQSSQSEIEESEAISSGEESSIESSEESEIISEDNAQSTEELSEEISEDTSEEDIYEDNEFKLPEEYRHLESAKALENMSKSLKNTAYLELSGETKISGNTVTMSVKMWNDPKNGNILSETSAISMGTTLLYEQKLTTDGKTYSINHATKTCTVVEDQNAPLEEILDFSTVKKVENKNELVGLEIYSTDWFILENGSSLGIYVKNNQVKYICIRQTLGTTVSDMLFKMTISKDISKADFTIPQGYTIVE